MAVGLPAGVGWSAFAGAVGCAAPVGAVVAAGLAGSVGLGADVGDVAAGAQALASEAEASSTPPARSVLRRKLRRVRRNRWTRSLIVSCSFSKSRWVDGNRYRPKGLRPAVI